MDTARNSNGYATKTSNESKLYIEETQLKPMHMY